MTQGLSVLAPDGVGEVAPGDDLAALLLAVCTPQDGDVVTVTSKVVSKAEGRFGHGDREVALAGETARIVARRSPTTIVRNHLGLTMAAAGIDNSNVEAGQHLLLPIDPDASAHALREAVRERIGHNVAVVITDTAGRTWRHGQTDIAIGAAGLRVLEDFGGQTDAYGNILAVTAPAVADEIASAVELASGKLGGRPFAILRGRADLVLPAGDAGPGARALVREDGEDLFGFGSREAVIAALAGRDAVAFGAPAPVDDLARALSEVVGGTVQVVAGGAEWRPDPERALPVREVVRAVAFAHGWRVDPAQWPVALRFLPVVP
ncbi:coenzyme F420-0:L-glutamate ligase [Nocardioides alcanivorans]|uniref:coenzyme F420-0:L-glutamate ligase n=1 Tax=Nocardioides alcanivorans TaxID=2897352 RepID=UPI001F245535|nr:coenzyme F420-0:L-glutamate ligase [Nocardioides alcanivorans]